MDNITLGSICRYHRKKLGLRQSDVSAAVGCSKENISAFETGRNNSARILMWYIEHGLNISEEVEKWLK